jgi:hypothetical protein
VAVFYITGLLSVSCDVPPRPIRRYFSVWPFFGKTNVGTIALNCSKTRQEDDFPWARCPLPMDFVNG